MALKYLLSLTLLVVLVVSYGGFSIFAQSDDLTDHYGAGYYAGLLDGIVAGTMYGLSSDDDYNGDKSEYNRGYNEGYAIGFVARPTMNSSDDDSSGNNSSKGDNPFEFSVSSDGSKSLGSTGGSSGNVNLDADDHPPGDGGPLTFSIDGEACTIRQVMGSPESTYWKLNLYTTKPAIKLNMDRNLCDGMYILGIDQNNNGALDSGYEILWLPGFDAFELLHNLDYYNGVYDGVFNSDDPLWKDALVMDSDYQYYHPEEFGIHSVNYYYGVQRFDDDQYDTGVYADLVELSSEHFRIMAHHPTGLIFDDNSSTDLFGIVVGPLWDCTINDVRYHVAEKITASYIDNENIDDPTQLYIDALDFCDDFEESHKHPDKYLSHWIAGIASMQHKKGLTDFNMLLQAKETYEKALDMAPDNPFFNVDYCLLNKQLHMTTDECIPKVQQAIDQRPDVIWFQKVHYILTGDLHGNE